MDLANLQKLALYFRFKIGNSLNVNKLLKSL